MTVLCLVLDCQGIQCSISWVIFQQKKRARAKSRKKGHLQEPSVELCGLSSLLKGFCLYFNLSRDNNLSPSSLGTCSLCESSQRSPENSCLEDNPFWELGNAACPVLR